MITFEIMNKHLSFLIILVCFGWGISGVSQTQNNNLYLILKENDSIQQSTTSFSNYNDLEKYVDSISKNLQMQGYLTSFYQKPERTNDSTYTSTLIKHQQTQFIQIKNWDSLSKLIRENTSFKKESTLKIEQLQNKLKQWNAILSNDGSPFNNLQLSDFETGNDTLFANLLVKNLKRRQIDSIIVKGYPKFPTGFLTYYIGLKKNNRYQNDKVLEKTQQLNNLPFVSTIKPAEVLFNPNSTQLYLYIKKQNANNFDGFIGFSTDEDSGNLVLDGYLNLNLINNLNFGEEVNLTYKSDSEEQQQFRINAKLPYIFKLPLGVEAGFYSFRQKDVFSTSEQNIGINYAFSPRIEAFAGYKTYESANLNEENVVAGSININYDARFLQIEARYNRKQTSLLFPFKTRAVLSSEIGSRTLAESSQNQFKVGLRFSHIFKLSKRNSIYVANNAQYLNSDNYINNELYRLGGILSIRGFEENSLRASLFNVINTEYRYQLSETIYAHSIIDFAYIDNQTARSLTDSEPVGSNQLTSFGVGLGMLTKAGLFRLNYANGRSDDVPFEFGNSKVHISLTAYF